MADIATLGLAVDSREVFDASSGLDRLTASAKKAEDAAGGFGRRAEDAAKRASAANDNAARSAEKVSTAYGKWEKTALAAARAVGLIAGALATNVLIGYADAWSDMQSRVGAAVKDMQAAPALMQRMVDIANASYSPLDQTVEVYSRNVAVLRDLGRGATEAADFTEALNHALVITATRGERAASVQNALSKAMAVGRLQADGLETVLANGSEVAQVLADKLGTTQSGLRAMASQSKITGDVIASALISRLDDLRERAAEMPATIGDAFTRLQTNLTAFIGQMDQATGASQAVSAAIMLLANNIDVIARAAAVAGVALLTAFAPAILAAMASGFVALGSAGVAAVTAITVAIAANPIGALAVALTTAVTAAYLFRDEIREAIGVDFVAIIEGAMNTVIGVFVGGFQAVAATWRQLPAALGDLAYQAGYLLADNIRYWINEAILLVDGFIGSLNGYLGTNIGRLSTLKPVQNNNPYKGAAAGVADTASAAMSTALSRDYIGALKEIAFGTRSAEEATNDMAAAMNAANAAMNNVGGGGGAADKAAQAIKGVADEAAKAAQAALDFGKDLVKGFVSDLRSGLEQGKGFWRSFGDAAMNVLDKIVDKLLNNVIDALFQVNSVGGSGGGLLGGILGFLPKLLGFARGGYTGPGAASQPAGIVHAGEYVFSKAAVDRIGVNPLDQLHRSAKGYAGGGFVERMYPSANRNLPGFAGGGYVPQPPRPAAHGSAALNLRVEVQNNSSAQVEVGEPRQDANGDLVLPMIINQVVDKVAESVNKGKVGRTLEATYGLKRVTR